MHDYGKRLGADMIRGGRELMEPAGATSVRDFGLSPVLGWHLMGTARMGNDPRSSMVDANNRSTTCRIYSSPRQQPCHRRGVNPTHTIQAVALRRVSLDTTPSFLD
jgi:choline dehydrogenase-like flavoprotein